jgi:serine/threonine-protein kinase
MTTATLLGGRYRLEDVIGRGGMALVYRAQDTELGTPVAIKILADNLAADPDLRRRFVREAQLAGRLSHPNVVRVLGQGEVGGRPYIVLEHVAGRSVGEELSRVGRFPPERARALGAQAAAGLAAAHAQGLVHRDVKPQNLLLTAYDGLKVSDFGIARAADGTQLTQVGTILGTTAYLAPEQAAGQDAGPAADVYALGVVLYELLTGRPPYEASSVAELVLVRSSRDPLPPSELAPSIPVDADSLVLRCLRPEPELRPTARDVERTLRGDLEAPTRVVSLTPEQATTILRSRRGRRRVVVGGVVALAAATALGLALASGGGSTPSPTRTPPQVAPIPPATTAAQEARNLSRWLRRNVR